MQLVQLWWYRGVTECSQCSYDGVEDRGDCMQLVQYDGVEEPLYAASVVMVVEESLYAASVVMMVQRSHCMQLVQL